MTEAHRRLSYEASCQELVRWKSDPECVWLNDCPSQALQQSLKDLDRAFCNFASGRTGAPRFKKRGRHDNFRLPQGCKLEAHHARVFLPRIGWARIRLTRTVEGAIGAVSVTHRAGRWFICIQTLRTIEPRGVGIGTVGIDLGVTRFATLFDGTKEVVIKSPAPDPGLVSGLRRAEPFLAPIRRPLCNRPPGHDGGAPGGRPAAVVTDFGSGARDESKRDGPEISAEQTRLYREAKSTFDRLAGASLARIAHYLIQTLEPFVNTDPDGVFALIARSVRSSERGGYSLEGSGADLIVRIVERYLADHRSIFFAESRLADLMDSLDSFVRAGWPSAQSLTFRLGEIWR